ncbi:MAG: family 43 glycosylhydrolase [Lachnospiraceae bacterium]
MKKFQNPFIIERADPFITVSEEGCYYFTASYPAMESEEHGFDRIILRKGNSLEQLIEAEEIVIWKAEPGAFAKHVWAPELHKIENQWYLFFACAPSENKWKIRPCVLVCKEGGDVMCPDDWSQPVECRPMEEDNYSFSTFSLDMTYFYHKGEHYVIWAQKEAKSKLYIGKVHGKRPWQLITAPTLLSEPEFGWEMINEAVNEGPAVVKHNGKIYVFFSASGTGSEYCVGMMYAPEASDLCSHSSWTKLDKPVFKTLEEAGEYGPGHNSFTVDEAGREVFVYHARPREHEDGTCGYCQYHPLYDPCRHTRIRYINWITEDNVIIE